MELDCAGFYFLADVFGFGVVEEVEVCFGVGDEFYSDFGVVVFAEDVEEGADGGLGADGRNFGDVEFAVVFVAGLA